MRPESGGGRWVEEILTFTLYKKVIPSIVLLIFSLKEKQNEYHCHSLIKKQKSNFSGDL